MLKVPGKGWPALKGGSLALGWVGIAGSPNGHSRDRTHKVLQRQAGRGPIGTGPPSSQVTALLTPHSPVTEGHRGLLSPLRGALWRGNMPGQIIPREAEVGGGRGVAAAESPTAGEGEQQADQAHPPRVTCWPDSPASPGMAAPRPCDQVGPFKQNGQQLPRCFPVSCRSKVGLEPML